MKYYQGSRTDVTALVKYAQALELENDQLRAALQPFADYAPKGPLDKAMPDAHRITAGSPMAARQLTIGDCRRARDAFTPPLRSDK